jgi:hypothetical protein
VLVMVGVSAIATVRYVRDQATEILPAAAILQRTARPQDFVVARKPHIAFTGGLQHLPPLQTDDPAAFFAWIRNESGARFLYVGPSEVGMLPFLEPLSHGQGAPVELELLHRGVAPADGLYAVR